ncbi:MAG TPA: ABC transporter ATP-binding protein [Trueperaceae bacterium]
MVISLRNLTRAFGDNLALDAASFEVAAGEVFGLLGHNGAGKTTTVRLLNGLLEPTSGSASVFGLDPSRDGTQIRRRTGVSTETPSVDDRMTGRDTLHYFAELYGVPKREVAGRTTALLAGYGLIGAADDRVGSYSKGMKQRLALARTLIHEPELLFLDEPTSGLDPVATKGVNELIGRLSREEGRTVLLCTHNLAQAQQLCQRVAVLEKGRVVALGAPHELARDLGMRRSIELQLGDGELGRALTLLRSRPEFGTATGTGGTLQVTTVERELIPELVRLLAAEGLHIYSVETSEPSLEDVYFELYDRQSGATA